jgi:hypothetical protein
MSKQTWGRDSEGDLPVEDCRVRPSRNEKDSLINIVERMERWKALNLTFNYEVARYLLDKYMWQYVYRYFLYILNNLVRGMECSVVVNKYALYFS